MSGKGYKIFAGLLSACLAFIFVTFGVIKLTPKLSVDIHKQVYGQFVQFSRVHPAVYFGYKIDPKKFMPQIGAIEVVCGVLLVIGPRITKMFSCLVLSSVIVGGLYFIYILGQPLQNMFGFAVILLLLLVRVNMFATQPSNGASKETTEMKKQKVSAKKIN